MEIELIFYDILIMLNPNDKTQKSNESTITNL